jgi:hypothetical protein
MKRVLFILLVLLAAQTAVLAYAKSPSAPSYTVVLAGGVEESMIRIWLTPDGRSYVIDSVAPLEVGGTICENAPGNPNELICHAPLVAGFEVNAGPGSDSIMVARNISIPVTLRGGGGQDTLVGGNGPDKLLGGDGNDDLGGRGGDDVIYGGPGNDRLSGGPGKDVLRGGTGDDTLGGGIGPDNIHQDKIEL